LLIPGKLYYVDNGKDITVVSAEVIGKYNSSYKQISLMDSIYIGQQDILFFICTSEVKFPYIGQSYEMFVFFYKDKIIGIDLDQLKYLNLLKSEGTFNVNTRKIV